MEKLRLKPGKDASCKRFHPWIFSGALSTKPHGLADGTLVEVLDHQENYLATGYYQDGSICVRILTFKKQSIDQDFWTDAIAGAYQFRRSLGFSVGHTDTNCFRLVHGEGDGLPGLIVDIYHSAAVIQCHTIGMFLLREHISTAIQQVLGPAITTVYHKSKEALPKDFASTVSNGWLVGEANTCIVQENGHSFKIDWVLGQKTGFFLDQRENRLLLQRYVAGKTVLNAFCYTGGFSVYALAAGATSVHSIDISEKAVAWANENILFLGPELAARHTAMVADVLKFLQSASDLYECIVVDPPAYAKNLDKKHNAVQAYKRLNIAAIQRLAPGGILFTFSCSQVVDPPLFYNTIVAAAIEAGRKARVMHFLSQGPDHPISIFHPEGNYLKGLVMFVE